MEKKKATTKKQTNANKKTSTSKKISKKKTKGRNKKMAIWQNVITNKKLLVVSLFALVIAIYCVYKVVALIQNPTDTFSVEQGRIYQEESTTRLYY